MELVKITGGIMLVVCGALAGLYAAGRFRDRVKLCEQYLIFLNRAKTALGYTAPGVRELLEPDIDAPQLSPVMRDAAELMDDGMEFRDAWISAVGINVQDSSDRELICRFGESFGTSNISGELNKLSLHMELVKEHLDMMKEELKTKRKLYRIVGMFGGVLTAVLLL